MKTCLLLSGHYRTFELTRYQWQKNVIEPNESDVFFHSYTTNGRRMDGDIKNKGSSAKAEFDQSPVTTEQIYAHLPDAKHVVVDAYEYVALKEEFKKKSRKIKDAITERFQQDRRVEWMFSQYYKRLEGIKMILASGTSYDLCMSSRPDIGIYAPVDMLTMDPTKIHISYINPRISGYSDFYIIASPENLLKIYGIYDEINGRLFDEIMKQDSHLLTCGHALLTTYINTILDLPVVEIPCLGDIVR